MAKQTITLRLDEEDLSYLAGLDVAGATNLSEKIRALLADARRQREGLADPAAAYDFAKRLLAQSERRLRDAEVRQDLRSELLHRALEWTPDLLALLLAADAAGPDPSAQLRRLERQVGERLLTLTDSLLQQAVSGFPGCYDGRILSERAQSALRILGTVQAKKEA
ncbi:hypothetical protein [Solimonas sp. SE-A11]|uniref:hypothetical protein n=1 Tax=Solimonas sp. SE-A11 TaxID=3054954 RepID=UPI00259C8DA9|nr:hypothetical protein [Solimonas sp. SE-A11]MDM4770324.1 hypothetical protein [Solimonas sp. SE-A11]